MVEPSVRHQSEPTRQENPYGRRMKWDDHEAFVGLPKFSFLFDIPQVCSLLSCTKKELETMCHRPGLDEGKPPKSDLQLLNLGTIDDPNWRVDYVEFKRFCTTHKIPIYSF